MLAQRQQQQQQQKQINAKIKRNITIRDAAIGNDSSAAPLMT